MLDLNLIFFWESTFGTMGTLLLTRSGWNTCFALKIWLIKILGTLKLFFPALSLVACTHVQLNTAGRVISNINSIREVFFESHLASRENHRLPPTQHPKAAMGFDAAAELDRTLGRGDNTPTPKQPVSRHVGNLANVASSTPTLETLPAKLRIEILSYLTDLNDLRAAVRASPILHQQYLLSRQRLLGNSLKAALRSQLVDAYIHRRSSTTNEQCLDRPQHNSESRPALTVVKEDYGELRSASPGICTEDRVLERCGLEDLTDMASFYRAVVQPLLKDCLTYGPEALESLRFENRPEASSLGNNTRARLQGAIYRYYIYQNLVGTNDKTTSFQANSIEEELDVQEALSDTFIQFELDDLVFAFYLIPGKPVCSTGSAGNLGPAFYHY